MESWVSYPVRTELISMSTTDQPVTPQDAALESGGKVVGILPYAMVAAGGERYGQCFSVSGLCCGKHAVSSIYILEKRQTKKSKIQP